MKIMVVDDEPIILTGIENIIINEFSECVEIVKAFDGIDALEKLNYFTPDLIITDISMPEISGLELIEKVLKNGICSRFIILTAYADFEYARKAIQYKALDYIVKPIDKVKLVELLNNISKKIGQEQEELINLNLNKIREIMLYDIPYEEFFLEKNVVSMIFPLKMFMVILIQIENNYREYDVTMFDTILSGFFNKYKVFSLQHKNQIVILSNLDQRICEKDLYKELSCFKIKGFINIKSIGISSTSDRIDSIHTLYNDALRHLYFYKQLWDEITYEESDIKKALALMDYHEIAKILESNTKEDMGERLNIYLEKPLSINNKDIFYLNSVYSIVISDIAIYLNNLGLTLDAIFVVNKHIDDEIISISDDVQLKNQVQSLVAKISYYLREKHSSNRYSESVTKMIDYINKNYVQDIRLDDIAETVDLHPNYASTLFKKEMGTSFIQYLNSYRIRKAKAFIKRDAELSVEHIAEMVGYENSGRFIKVFKKYCNITPGEYRKVVSGLTIMPH